MTEREVIEALKLEGGIEITGNPGRVTKFFEALDMAISALKEIQQYRKIGTVEECRKSVVVEAFEELINEYGVEGEFIVNNKRLSAEDLLKELKDSSEVGKEFEKEINKTIISYFMKFRG